MDGGEREPEDGATTPLFTGFDAAYEFIDEADGRLYFRTTKNAPLGRIISIDPERPQDVHEVVAEGADRLSMAAIARDRVVVAYLHNASDRLRLFDLDGAPRGEIALPGIGSIVSLDAEAHDGEREGRLVQNLPTVSATLAARVFVYAYASARRGLL